ncbi:MAG: hypothetical protein AAFX76_14520, partial [Planctomycetota bacterium]
MLAMNVDGKATCSGCGYDLLGLDRRGNCPECGQPYDMDTGRGVRLRSAAMEAHERGDRVVFLFKFWGLVGVAAVSMILGAVTALDSPKPNRPIVLGAMF